MIRTGQKWKRRDPVGDGYDEIEITGRLQITENDAEFALRPVGGLEVISATAESIQAAFVLVSETDETDKALGVDCLSEWTSAV